MTSLSETSLVAVLLAQRLIDTAAPALKAREYWSLLDQVPDPGVLLGRETSEIAAVARVPDELAARIAVLLDAASAVVIELGNLAQRGVQVVASVDQVYPDRLTARLGPSAPPLLYAVGDLTLADHMLLGIVGSRSVNEAGAETAKQAAREAAENGTGVVSGGAKGVDRLAMLAALEAGTPVVGVLADALDRVTRDKDVRRAVIDGSLCLCTPYKPTAGFSVANAMGRNKVIYALSAATLVVSADAERGGTWAGAVEALRRRSAPVLAWMGDGSSSGNRELVKRGAVPLAATDRLFPLPARSDAGSPFGGDQMRLGFG